MSLTRSAIEKNRVTLALLAVLVVTGIQSYFAMPQSEDPGFVVRTALVTTQFPGAAPERVEQLVTDKLEKAIQEMPQLSFISSQSKTGVSILFVNIQERYREMRPIWDDLRRKVERASRELPEGVIGPFVDDEFGDVYGTLVTLTGDGYSYADLEEVADEVRDELLRIPEVAKVEIHGAQEERIFVEYSNPRLAELGVSPLQLRNILESRNIINPGGEIRTDDEQIVLEPTGNFQSIEDLRRTLFRVPGSDQLLTLGDVAEVFRGYVDPPRSLVKVSGRPGLVLAVSLREGGNILELGRQVRATLARVERDYPVGVDLGTAIFQADEVRRKVDDFVGNLAQAIGLVILVMLATLGVRTGLVVASLIPMAMVASFIFMSLLDVGINQMSLAALIISLGLLVDNAIVVSESVQVEMRAGTPALEAAVGAAGELKLPLLTSSLTTAAAFLPIYLAESTTGEYTAPLFMVVTITLLCSWALSLTMIPLFAVLFFKRSQVRAAGGGGYDTPFYRRYRALLAAGLRHRTVSLFVVAAAFAGALVLLRFVPVIFFPPNDRATLTAELRLPTGTPLARTRAVVRQVEGFLARGLAPGAGAGAIDGEDAADGEGPGGGSVTPGAVTGWVSFLGAGAPRFILSFIPEPSSPEYAILVISAASRAAVDEIAAALRDHCLDIPGLEARIDPLPLGPPARNPIEVRISGREAGVVFERVDRVKARLEAMSGPRAIGDDWGSRSKKILVRIDEARAQRAGVTHQDVALSLQTLFSGFDTTEYREGDDLIPVILRSEQAGVDPRRLGSLNVFAQATGRSVPLAQVADIELAWQPANIRRRDRLKTVTVEADLEPGATAAEVIRELVPWLADESAGWPPGTTWALGGEEEESAKANTSILAKLPIAGLLIVLLLVAQFNSLRRTAIVLITIPLGLIGVVLGLLVMRSYFGFMTLLGIISLAGIVINNAIVLIDRIEIERAAGVEAVRAILESAQRRLRPILLTTVTTIGGLIPLYVGGGPMYRPMAVAIIFGLLFATGLTLGVVPILYSMFLRVDVRRAA